MLALCGWDKVFRPRDNMTTDQFGQYGSDVPNRLEEAMGFDLGG